MMIRRGRPRSAGTISYHINNRTELLAVIQNASSAGTYTVAPGSYGDIVGLEIPEYTSAVNLVGFGAVLGDVEFAATETNPTHGNVTFDGFEANSFFFGSSHDITLQNNYVHGADYLVTFLDTNKTTARINILNNVITNAGVDCLRVATGTGGLSGYATDILIEGNFISEAGYLGYSHPDAFQAWNYCYTGAAGVFDLGRCGINNFTIKKNIILGDQEGPQGLFLNNEAGVLYHTHNQGPVAATLTKIDGPGSWTTISGTFTWTATGGYVYDADGANKLASSTDIMTPIAVHDRFSVAMTNGADQHDNHGLEFICTYATDPKAGNADLGPRLRYIRRHNIRHSNVLIEDNFIYLNSPHGISCSYVDGLTAKNNVLIGACQDVPSGLRTMSIIAQLWCRNVSVESNNVLVANPATDFYYQGSGSGIANPTTKLTQADQRRSDHISKHFVNAQRRVSPIADDFQVLGSSSLYSHPAMVAYRSLKPPGALYIKPTLTYGLNSLSVTLDAVKIIDDSVNAGCTYDWDFGDGTSHGSGQSVSHTYSYQGEYYVTCAVTGAVTQSLRRTVIVRDPLVSYLPLSADLVDLGWDSPNWTPTGTLDFSGEGVELGSDKPQFAAANATRLDQSMSEITFSFEFYKAAGDSFGVIARNFGYSINYYSGDLRFTVDGVGYVTTNNSYSDSTWRRVTGVYSSVTGAMKLYVDNTLVASATGLSGDVGAAVQPMQFGYGSSGNDFGGRIRNVVIIAGIPTITGDAAKTAIDAFIAARQFSGTTPTAPAKAVSLARGTTTSWDATVGATGGPWLPNWVSLGSVSGAAGEIGSAQDGLVHFSAGSSPGTATIPYSLRTAQLRDSNTATITVTIT